MGTILKKNDSRRKYVKQIGNDGLIKEELFGKRFFKNSDSCKFDYFASVIQKATRRHIAKKRIFLENEKSKYGTFRLHFFFFLNYDNEASIIMKYFLIFFPCIHQ